MEPYPPSLLHEEDADNKEKLRGTHRRKCKRDTILLVRLSNLSFILFCMVLPMYLFCNMPPEFSIQLEQVKGFDDTPASGAGMSISSAFSLTLHDNNRLFTRRCYHNGEALVSYGGFTIATGRVPGFCVPGKGDREVQFLASADGVGLPEHVLDRMALERRIGATQLDVEVKLFRRDDGSDRPMWIWCGLRMDSAQPSNVISCTVLGLQHWFS
ncbi:hypothetical protein PR202_ga09905 [Eleusine coracana subsp. coracana]|uniref:Late embryogenesis abundant protein LEA-2 subgroup domain-containing protein n=1 Tax=Eleusine coracana subsp. coracana TaxID=191504 RepID=A0AAV5C5H0_ELECO|nr:hypothetical protein PR202_ga09905 [Eleusine coracana subsp. coracana]